MLRSGCLKTGLHASAKPEKATIPTRLWFVLASLLVLCSAAGAQNFTLQMSTFQPIAVDPGGQAESTLTLGVSGGFSGSVDLSCEITPAPPNGNAGCQVSPSTVTPPTGASVTISTTNWVAGGYTIAITGTSSTSGSQTVTQRLSVLSVTPSFTVTVGAAIVPSSVPAGRPGVGTIDVNPIYGYSGNVTLACTSVSPVVTYPPVCSFSYPPGETSLPVLSGVTATSTLTITTIGPTTITRSRSRAPRLYAVLFALPITLVGLGAAAGGKRSRAWGVLGLTIVSGTLLLIPACGTTTQTTATTPSQYITPNNTYTFTVTAIDDKTGASASNTGSGSLETVTLTVTSATTD